MFPLNKKLSTDNVLNKLEERELLINKVYTYWELSSEQRQFVKEMGFNMCSGDSIVFSLDNLEYIERLAKRRGLKV